MITVSRRLGLFRLFVQWFFSELKQRRKSKHFQKIAFSHHSAPWSRNTGLFPCFFAVPVKVRNMKFRRNTVPVKARNMTLRRNTVPVNARNMNLPHLGRLSLGINILLSAFPSDNTWSAVDVVSGWGWHNLAVELFETKARTTLWRYKYQPKSAMNSHYLYSWVRNFFCSLIYELDVFMELTFSF